MQLTGMLFFVTFIACSAQASKPFDADDLHLDAAPSCILLNAMASEALGRLLREADLDGNPAVLFNSSQDITQFTVDDTTCNFQSGGGSVTCSTVNELSPISAKVVGNLACYFQNTDDSVSCSAWQ